MIYKTPNPPAFNNTAATTPSKIAQVTLDNKGESLFISTFFLDESMDATSAPESEEVTKKVTISISEIIDNGLVNDKESNKTKRAVLALELTAPLISPMLLST